MLMQKVVTINGNSADKDKCRKIRGQYYVIGDIKKKDSGDCYPIHNGNRTVYYTLTGGRIAWDYETKEYSIISKSNMVQGVVDDKGTIGYFTPDNTKNVLIRTYDPGKSYAAAVGSTTLAWCEEVLGKSFKLSRVDGIYYPVEYHRAFSIDYCKIRKNDMSMYPNFQHGVYSLADRGEGEVKVVKEAYDRAIADLNPSEMVCQMKPVLGNFTFGLEFETAFGRLPQHMLYRFGTLPMKDGSLSSPGIEYVTLPLSGASGVQNVIELAKELQSTCMVDKMCSLHVHVGNVLESCKTDQEKQLLIIATYMLYYQLQREIFGIIPNYKKTYEFLASKNGKDHCQDLFHLNLFHNKIFTDKLNEEELEKEFTKIFTFANDNRKPSARSNWKTRTFHNPDAAKWNIESRYYVLNFFNAFFSDSNTFEFRAHSGTVNPVKTFCWLAICLGIMRFAKDNVELIIRAKTKFNLYDIVSQYPDMLQNYLIEYINHRQEQFTEAFFSKDHYAGEFKLDSTFNHKPEIAI